MLLKRVTVFQFRFVTFHIVYWKKAKSWKGVLNKSSLKNEKFSWEHGKYFNKLGTLKNSIKCLGKNTAKTIIKFKIIYPTK